MEKDSHKDSSSKQKPSFFERFTNKRAEVSEDEILELLDEAPELADDEKRMIQDIIDLGDTVVNEICTPRVDVMLVEDNETGRAALERMRGTGYSRLPVCHDNIDDIIGIVHYKDLIGPLMDGSIDEPVTRFMYKPMFVPETKDVIPLLGEMQAKHQQMAIVVDEYGGTEGLITIEDIVEEIVGEIADESDIGGELLTFIEPGVWRADGRFPVEDAIELGWPVQISDDYETIAGWLMLTLDSVPKTGEMVVVDGYEFKILKMRRSRISLINVKRLEHEVLKN
ncbi:MULTISPECIES: hemolysin family protein [unclassified Adlercreutzia]|uniref:hemolysin family protein n=1 Tax=unclassified Adlercreutzia TaxID=2636013 RepID=UPI0013EBE6CC|nr:MULTISPECIES: hemolysin family protein [unclassified Adlercreutzia]